MVSIPRCGCHGNPFTYSSGSSERKSSRSRNGSYCSGGPKPIARWRWTPAPSMVARLLSTWRTRLVSGTHSSFITRTRVLIQPCWCGPIPLDTPSGVQHDERRRNHHTVRRRVRHGTAYHAWDRYGKTGVPTPRGDQQGNVVLHKRISRKQGLPLLAQVPPYFTTGHFPSTDTYRLT